MNIKLILDTEFFIFFVPDNYVSNCKELKNNFIQWAQEQPESIKAAPSSKFGFCYTEELFLRYINEVVLRESNEKSYIVHQKNIVVGKGRIIRL